MIGSSARNGALHGIPCLAESLAVTCLLARMMNMRRVKGSSSPDLRNRGSIAPWEEREPKKPQVAYDDSYRRFDMDTTTLIGDHATSKSQYGVAAAGDASGLSKSLWTMLWRQMPIACLLLLIAFAYYVYVYKLCYRHLWRRAFYYTAAGYVSISHLILLLLLWSYFHATYTHPGRVPHDIDPQSVLSWSEWTLCEKCKRHRPPRAHHCTTCGRCVLKMGMQCLADTP